MNFYQIGSYKIALWITIAASTIGFALILGGAVLTGLSFTEIRPNVADENYNRYMGAHLQKTIGPVMLAFGALLLFGGCIFLGFVIFASQTGRSSKTASSKSSSRKEVY